MKKTQQTSLHKTYSLEHQKYVRNLKKDKGITLSVRFLLLVVILGLWEVFATVGVIDAFFFSCPSKIYLTFVSLVKEGSLWLHMGVTLYETVLGFLIATTLGSLIAVLLWWNKKAREVLEPYIIILNSLPKVALGPIIILWVGSGTTAIITMCVLICVIITTISMLNAFLSCEKDKPLLMQSMHASKFQIFWKLVLPNALPEFISVLKINVGMSWVGTIMGEYLSSSAGLGYLIVYGSQLFKIDLVMTSTVLLCLLAGIMYGAIVLIEKRFKR